MNSNVLKKTKSCLTLYDLRIGIFFITTRIEQREIYTVKKCIQEMASN